MQNYKLNNLGSDSKDFKYLINMYHNLKDLVFEDIEIDFENVTFFNAAMSANLGAILYKLSNANQIKIINVQGKPQTILQKNGFLSSFGFPKMFDSYNTTVPYMRFNNTDEKFFDQYVSDLVSRDYLLPQMDSMVRNEIKKSIFELFNNVVCHSESKEGAFCCGQFFPTDHIFEFMIVDLGIGIKNRILKDKGQIFDGGSALEWVMTEGSTTKNGNIPGGLGLKLLKNLIELNHGALQICSNEGFWKMNYKGHINTWNLENEFPGTIINFTIKTNDPNFYRLKPKEIIDNDLF